MITGLDIFRGTSGPHNARIMIVGEAYGAEEDRLQRPFVGSSGQLLDKMLTEAGIDPRECFKTNLICARPHGNDFWRYLIPTKQAKAEKLEVFKGLFVGPTLRKALTVLDAQITEVRPSLIIACGNYPLWYLTDGCAAIKNLIPKDRNSERHSFKVPAGITYWRGSQVYHHNGAIPVLPLIHPAAIDRDWSQRAITVHDLRIRVPLALRRRWSAPVRDYLAPPTFNQAVYYLTLLIEKLGRSPAAVVVDLETYRRSVITCIGLTHDGRRAISIPFLIPGSDAPSSFWSFDQEVTLVYLLRRVLNHPNARIIGQNFLYDTQYNVKWWLTLPRCYFDTMGAQHVMFPGTPKPLWYLASLYCVNHYRFWKDDSKEWEAEGDLETHLTYNCDDCIYTWQVWQAQEKLLNALRLRPQFDFKMREWQLAFKLMDRGLRVAPDAHARMRMKLSETAAERQRFLEEVVPSWVIPPTRKGATRWYNSSTQQKDIFYNVLGLKTVLHRKTKSVTFDDTALTDLRLRYRELAPIFDALADLRSLGVFQNNFMSATLDPDGRMRSSLNPFGPETMRWSSSENAFGRGTNMQNIPKGIDKHDREEPQRG